MQLSKVIIYFMLNSILKIFADLYRDTIIILLPNLMNRLHNHYFPFAFNIFEVHKQGSKFIFKEQFGDWI